MDFKVDNNTKEEVDETVQPETEKNPKSSPKEMAETEVDENAKIVKLHFLDILGYLLYHLNKTFFKDETYPSNLKIFIWDKIFTPVTIIIDYLTGYKFGKNILCVYKKTSD